MPTGELLNLQWLIELDNEEWYDYGYRNKVHLLSIVGGGLDDGRPS